MKFSLIYRTSDANFFAIITSDLVITIFFFLIFWAIFLGDGTWSLFFWATQRNGFWEGITCTLSYFLVFCVSYVEVPHASSPSMAAVFWIGYLTQNDIIYPSIWWWFCHGNHLHKEFWDALFSICAYFQTSNSRIFSYFLDAN